MDLCEIKQNVNRHPWEISRSKKVLKLFRIHPCKAIADVGAGDQYFIHKLRQLQTGKFYAVDSGYDFEKKEINGIISLNDIQYLPDKTIDCIFLMDVLEHVSDEDAFVETLLEKMSDEGQMIITVPAFQSLFSSHDFFLKHFRRYKKRQLEELLMRHNIVIEKSFYFYISLFIYRYFEKALEPKAVGADKNMGIGNWKYAETHFFTRFIVALLNFDFKISQGLSRIGLNAAGLSLFAECRVQKREVK